MPYYLRPNYKTAKIFDLNKMMNLWSSKQPKYKETDSLVSKKILQAIKAKTFEELIQSSKFLKSIKKIKDILIEKGEISYLLNDSNALLKEEVVDMNYILHKNDNVWKYYLEKQEKDKISKKKK